MSEESKIEERTEDEKGGFRNRKLRQFEISSQLFLAVLGFLGVIFMVDIVMRVTGFQTGEYTGNILETVKTLAFTICGYLFGKSKEDCE